MTERELRAVAAVIERFESENGSDYALAQAAISASDSKYVKGLVEKLKFIAKWYPDAAEIVEDALQNLPEDLRCPE